MPHTLDLRTRLHTAIAGRYVVESQLGSGGMATVLKARDLKHDRAVALKVLRPELSVGSQRFLREIQLAASLRHPHILPVHDSGESDGVLFYVMPYIEGKSLRDWIDRERQLALADVWRVVREVAGALGYAHERGVIHRDIKPANILLDGGHAVVADFGVAMAVGGMDGDRLTGPGFTVGTPEYMSPEQIEASDTVDARSDVYSLGCVAYEMLVGVPPFDGPTALAIMAKRFTQAPPSASAMRRDLPGGVDEVMVRALAMDPDERFATPAEFAEALAAAARTPTAGTGTRRAPSAARSIAVLPFLNLSTDPDSEYFTDGITEDVINALTKVGNLRVASRTSAFAFRGRGRDVREIGKQLGVETVLEGSVRKLDNRLRVTAQLIDVADGYHLWSEQFDREMKEVFAIQDEISQAIVGTLRVKLAAWRDTRLGTRQTANLEAYNLYVKGRYFWNRRGAGLLKAKDYFTQAIAADPEYAVAHAALADTFSLLGWYRALAPNDAFYRAKACARKAIELDDLLAEAHTSLAFVLMCHDWAWDEAEKEFTRSIALNPGLATTHHWYAEYLMAMGRLDDAVLHSKRALEIDPLGLIIHVLLGMAYFLARRYDDAIAECRKTIEMDPEFAPAHVWLGQSLLQQGRFAEAVEVFREEVRLSPERPTTSAFLAVAYAQGGETDRARELLAELDRRAETSYVSSFDYALIHLALGDVDRAFHALDRAVEERACWLTWIRVDPMFDCVRDDPRLRRILRRMHLTCTPR